MFPGGAGERRVTADDQSTRTARTSWITTRARTWRSISAISASVKSESLGARASWIPGNSSMSRNASSQWAASSAGRLLVVVGTAGWVWGCSTWSLSRRRSLRSSISSQYWSAVSDLVRRRTAAWRMRRSEETTVSVLGLESAAMSCSIRASAFSSPRAKRMPSPRYSASRAKSPGCTEASKTTVVCRRAWRPQRRSRAHRENDAARGETPRGPASARAGPRMHHVVSIDEPTHVRPWRWPELRGTHLISYEHRPDFGETVRPFFPGPSPGISMTRGQNLEKPRRSQAQRKSTLPIGPPA